MREKLGATNEWGITHRQRNKVKGYDAWFPPANGGLGSQVDLGFFKYLRDAKKALLDHKNKMTG